VAEAQGPVRPRQQLGKELRRLRLLAGLTQPAMAEHLGLSQSKVSRLETGTFRPEVGVVRSWLAAVRIDDPAERDRLLSMAEDAQTDTMGWREIYRGSIAAGQRKLLRQDAAATRIRHFQPFQVPGPFQTADYAKVVLLATRLAEEDDLDEAIALRLERGQRLRQAGAPEYHVILTELALRFRPFGATGDIHKAVWRELLASGDVPTMTVQVIPVDAPMRQAPMCAFIISDFDAASGESTVVDVELPAMEITTSKPEDVAAYETAWRRMQEAALSPDESLAFIAQLHTEQ
jgi:transcriptional regulator with XRE-family HTH domain